MRHRFGQTEQRIDIPWASDLSRLREQNIKIELAGIDSTLGLGRNHDVHQTCLSNPHTHFAGRRVV